MVRIRRKEVQRWTELWSRLPVVAGAGLLLAGPAALVRAYGTIRQSQDEAGELAAGESKVNCEFSAFEKYAKSGPAIIAYLLGVAYMATGIAIFADSFFISVLSVISDELRLTEDVAGATFMAMGSSAPELFSTGISLYKEKISGSSSSELGIGTIVGSSVFNIVVIIGASSLACSSSFALDWRAQMRDGFFYCASVLGIYFAFLDGAMHWWEGLCLFMSYIVYVLFMWKNEQLLCHLERFKQLLCTRCRPNREHSDSVTYFREQSCDIESGQPHTVEFSTQSSKHLLGNGSALLEEQNSGPTTTSEAHNETSHSPSCDSESDHSVRWRNLLRNRWRYAKELILQEIRSEEESLSERQIEDENETDGGGRMDDNNKSHSLDRHAYLRPRMDALAMQVTYKRRKGQLIDTSKAHQVLSFGQLRQIRLDMRRWHQTYSDWQGNAANWGELVVEKDVRESQSDKAETGAGGGNETKVGEEGSPLTPPSRHASFLAFVAYVLCLPFYAAFTFTTPPCWNSKWRRTYLIAFIVCLFWAGFLSYWLVEWATRISCILDIPPVIVGTILTAAATSVPDLIASIQVAKAGMPDMAVRKHIFLKYLLSDNFTERTANAVGSNTFDLLCGIGLPYAVILLAAEGPGGKIDVDTSRLGPSLIVLLGVVVAYYLPLHFTKWYLGPKLGVYLLCLYAIYIALQLIEWQVGIYRRA